MNTQRKLHHVEAYKNQAWNILATVNWDGEQYVVLVEPVTPSPYFIRQEPKRFDTLELAQSTAKAIAGH